jgi:dTDP-4-amino-4,6-dideoxygalactose transaminase
MKVKYLDLQKQFDDEAFFNVLSEQFKTCHFVMGPEVDRFELNFAELCQTPYAVALNSGTDAIFLALKTLSIGAGDEVITVPNSFIATAGAIIATGAKPVFVDVGDDYNINVELIERAITKDTRALIPVHLTGNPANMLEIMDIADRRKLYVLEDAAQAVGASINGRAVGSFGNAGCFSLHPLKNLNVCGDGGVLTTTSHEVYHNIRLLRNHGLKNRDEAEFFGYNSRLDTLQAVIANYVMNHIGEVTRKRQKNASIYDQALSELEDFVVLPPKRDRVVQVYHTYVVQVKQRTDLNRFLHENGVETKIHYPIPIHLQKPCRKMGYKRDDFPVCEKQAESIVSLPVHQHLSEEQVYYTINLIKKFYKTE